MQYPQCDDYRSHQPWAVILEKSISLTGPYQLCRKILKSEGVKLKLTFMLEVTWPEFYFWRCQNITINYRGEELYCAGDQHFASTLKKIHMVCEGMTVMIHATVLAKGASISAFPSSFISRLLQRWECQRSQEHIFLGFQESDTVSYSCYHSGIFMGPVPSCCPVIWALIPPDHMDCVK